VFGDSYRENFCKNGDHEGMVDSALTETIVFEILGEAPSLFNVLWWFPTTKALRTMDDCAEVALGQRRKIGSQSKDMMTFLVGLQILPVALTLTLTADSSLLAKRGTQPCAEAPRYPPSPRGDHCDPGRNERYLRRYNFRSLLPCFKARNIRQAQGRTPGFLPRL
jgi:hypothetical protein